jgi:hypothetical protein
MYVADCGPHRIQVYQKDVVPLGEDDIMAEPQAPSLSIA